MNWSLQRTVWLAFSSAAVLAALGCVSSPYARATETASTPAAGTRPRSAEVAMPVAAPPHAVPAATTTANPSTAARVCPAGPFGPPIAGTIQAAAIPGTEPTVLDPKDKVFHLYEGPVWLNDTLYFSDFLTSPGFPSRILRLSLGSQPPLAVVYPDSGSNGLALDGSGYYLAAARHKTKSIAILMGPDQPSQEVAKYYQGKRFNSPNDLVFRSDGNLYFTDPAFQAGDQRELSTTNVYRVGADGNVTAIDTTIRNPNGISLSPDERTLYVAGNMENGYVKSYPVAADGSVGEGKILFDGVHVPDGMVVDCAGNLYVTEHERRRVRVITKEGTELGQIVGMDANVTNVAFGGPERRTLFITGTGKLFWIKMPVPGLPY